MNTDIEGHGLFQKYSVSQTVDLRGGLCERPKHHAAGASKGCKTKAMQLGNYRYAQWPMPNRSLSVGRGQAESRPLGPGRPG